MLTLVLIFYWIILEIIKYVALVKRTDKISINQFVIMRSLDFCAPCD